MRYYRINVQSQFSGAGRTPTSPSTTTVLGQATSVLPLAGEYGNERHVHN